MNYMQQMFCRWTMIGFGFGAAFGFCIGYASAADLALPRHSVLPARPHILQIRPLPSAPTPVPTLSAAPELCLETGKNPYPGQTLQHDESCPTKMRWVRPK